MTVAAPLVVVPPGTKLNFWHKGIKHKMHTLGSWDMNEFLA